MTYNKIINQHNKYLLGKKFLSNNEFDKNESIELFNQIEKLSFEPKYNIIIDDLYNITIKQTKYSDQTEKSDPINIFNLTNLEYLDNLDILASFVAYMRTIDPTTIYKFDHQIEQSVIYVILLPTKVNDKLIIKFGYSKDLKKRLDEICNAFDISDVKLLLAISIKCEAYESAIHNFIKTKYNDLSIDTEKKTKAKKTKIIESSTSVDDNDQQLNNIIKDYITNSELNSGLVEKGKKLKSELCVETYYFDLIIILIILKITQYNNLYYYNTSKLLDIKLEQIKLEQQKLNLEQQKLNLEQQKQISNNEIEIEKIKLEQLKVQLELNKITFLGKTI